MSIFFYCGSGFCPCQNHSVFLIFPRNFADSSFTWRPLISLELTFVRGRNMDPSPSAFFPPLYVQLCQHPLLKRRFSLHIAFAYFSKINWPQIYKGLFLNSLFSYICPIWLPIPHCLDCCSFVLKLGCISPPNHPPF